MGRHTTYLFTAAPEDGPAREDEAGGDAPPYPQPLGSWRMTAKPIPTRWNPEEESAD